MSKLYKVYFCYQHEQARNPNQYKEFLCVTTVDRIAKIVKYYAELWDLIIAPLPNKPSQYIPNDELTESKILQEWEGLDPDALLEDIETGEKLWYITKRDGYELEAI